MHPRISLRPVALAVGLFLFASCDSGELSEVTPPGKNRTD